MSRQYAISGGHEITVEIARQILEEGGNAFDAGIAAHLAMYLTEPCMASAGAGGFALCYRPGEDVQMLDFFTKTPLSHQLDGDPDFRSILVNFGNETEEFHIGMASIAVPGSVDGIFRIHERYGSMPLKEIIAPVIDLATRGVLINTFQSIDMHLLEVVFRSDPSVKDIFFKDDVLIGEDEHFILPELPDFLEFLVREGRDGFYRGPIADTVEKACKEGGGYLSRADFEHYRAEWKTPLKVPFRDSMVYLPNRPCIGGQTMALLLDRVGRRSMDWLDAILDFKSQSYNFDELAEAFEARYPGQLIGPESGPGANRGTSHFNILDKDGNALALTCTIGEGSGYFIPGTNMQMNNMLGEVFLVPGGFHSWLPGVRLNSMMTPTMLTDKFNNLRFICGSGGAGRIPYMIGQMIDALVTQKKSLEEAMESPRVYVYSDTVQYESGYKGKTSVGLPVKEWKERSLFFGGVHAILVSEDGTYEAMGDPRRYGASFTGFQP